MNVYCGAVAQWSCNEFKTPDLTKFQRNDPASLRDRTKCSRSKTDSNVSEKTTKTRRSLYIPAVTNLISTL